MHSTLKNTVLVDTETTGPDPETCRLVEVFLGLVEDGELQASAPVRIHPGCPIPAEATAVHGISDADVAGCWPIERQAPTLRILAGKADCWLGYNASKFDVPLLARLADIKEPPVSAVVDPLIWIRKFDRYVKGSGRHKLEATCKRWGVPLQGAHSAEADSLATLELWKRMLLKFPRSIPSELGELLETQHRMAVKQEEDFQAWRASQPQANT